MSKMTEAAEQRARWQRPRQRRQKPAVDQKRRTPIEAAKFAQAASEYSKMVAELQGGARWSR